LVGAGPLVELLPGLPGETGLQVGAGAHQPGHTAGLLIDMTSGGGPDAIIDAVGMEARGHDEAAFNKAAAVAQRAVGLLADRLAQKVTDAAAVDRLDALHVAVQAGDPVRCRAAIRIA
jgi:hypothetical protein